MKKYLFFLAVSIFLIGTVSAAETEDYQIKYGSGDKLNLKYDYNNDLKLNKATLSICGYSKNKDPGNLILPDDGNVNWKFKVPEDAACALGTNRYTIDLDVSGGWQDFFKPQQYREDGTAVVTGNLNVQTDKSNPHQGSYLYVNMQSGVAGDTTPEVYDFYLSNEKWDHDQLDGTGTLLVNEVDGGNADEKGEFKIQTGEIISVESGFQLSDLETRYTSNPEDIDASEGDDPYDVLDVNFGSANTAYNSITIEDWTPSSAVSPVYEEGDYMPQGEIVVGEKYGYGDSPSGSANRKFNICREGQVSDWDGEAVYAPSDGSDYYKCTSGGEWQGVTTCGDEIDNDGNGAVDTADNDCSTTSSINEGPSRCSPRVGILEHNGHSGISEGTKGAFYNFIGEGQIADPDSHYIAENGCAYNSFDPDVEHTNQPPELFTCIGNIDYSNPDRLQHYSPTDTEDNGNAVDESGAEDACTRRANQIDDHVWEDYNNEMPVVEYFVAKEDIPIGYNKYATDEGFRNKFYQDLHQAMKDYAPGCTEVLSAQQCAMIFLQEAGLDTLVFREDVWQEANLTELSDGYNAAGDENGEYDSDYPDYMDSWTFANGGASNDNIYSPDGDTEENNVFNGGFAPRCESGQIWSWNDNTDAWECTGDVSGWDQAVLVPDILGGDESSTVGVVVMPYNFMEIPPVEFTDININLEPDVSNVRSYRQAASESIPKIDSTSDAPSLQSINVTCYSDANPGSSFKKEDEPINIDPDNPKPVAVTGQIDLSGSSSYTCNWNYTSSDPDRNPVTNAGNPVNIAKTSDNGKNEALFKFFKNDRGFTNLKKRYSPSEFAEVTSNWN